MGSISFMLVTLVVDREAFFRYDDCTVARKLANSGSGKDAVKLAFSFFLSVKGSDKVCNVAVCVFLKFNSDKCHDLFSLLLLQSKQLCFYSGFNSVLSLGNISTIGDVGYCLIQHTVDGDVFASRDIACDLKSGTFIRLG